MNRRRFLFTSLSLLGLGAVSTFIYSSFRYLLPPQEISQGSTQRVKKEEIPLGSSKDIVLNNIPVVIVNIPQRGYVAYSKVCTHLGCLVSIRPYEGYLHLPLSCWSL